MRATVDRRTILCLCILEMSLAGFLGCSAGTPADQFKRIADAEVRKLESFLIGRHSRLHHSRVSIVEVPVLRPGDPSHIGGIWIDYVASSPESETTDPTVNTAAMEYHFSAREKRWLYQGCVQIKGAPEPQEGLLVTFADIRAIMDEERQ